MTLIFHFISMALAILVMAALYWCARQAAARPGLTVSIVAGAYILWRLYAWS